MSADPVNENEVPSLPVGDQMDLYGQLEADEDTILLYHFDGDSTETVIDEAGNHHGTISGEPERVEGKWGQALWFDGVDDHVDTNWPVQFAVDDEFTLEFWFKAENIIDHGSMPIFGVEGGSGNNHPRFMSAIREPNHDQYPGMYVEYSDDSYTMVTMGTDDSSYDDGEWHYFAFVRGSGKFTLYIDGEQIDQADDNSGSGVNIGTLWIADREREARNYKGCIDEFRVSSIARVIQPELSIRVAGTPGNSVEIVVEQDGSVLESFTIYRTTGTPDSGMIATKADFTREVTLTLRFESIDGEGSNPVWLLVGDEMMKITTFNAKRNDVTTWNQEFVYVVEM